MSVGQQVERSNEPMDFVHGKRRQGFVHGHHAQAIDRILKRALKDNLMTSTPAVGGSEYRSEMKKNKKTECWYTKAILALTNERVEKSETNKLKIHYNCLGT